MSLSRPAWMRCLIVAISLAAIPTIAAPGPVGKVFKTPVEPLGRRFGEKLNPGVDDAPFNPKHMGEAVRRLHLGKDYRSPDEIIREESAKSDPNLNNVRDALSRWDWSPSEILALIKENPSSTDVSPLSKGTPNLLVRKPINKVSRLLTERFFESKLRTALDQEVDRASFFLMAFPQSSAAEAMLASSVPRQRQISEGMVGRISRGELTFEDFQMFSELKGKTLFVVGHIEIVKGYAAFEIRVPNQPSKYLRLDHLKEASERLGFNIVPLGCETGEALAVGTATKISDVDGINAFQRATAGEGRVKYGDLLAEISDTNLKIVIDPLKAENFTVFDVEIVDMDGRSYVPSGAPPSWVGNNTGQSPGGSQTSVPSQVQFALRNTDDLTAGCSIDDQALQRSYIFDRYFLLAQWIWPWLSIPCLVAFAICGFVETTVVEFRSQRQRPIPWDVEIVEDKKVNPGAELLQTYLGLCFLFGLYGFVAVSWGSNAIYPWEFTFSLGAIGYSTLVLVLLITITLVLESQLGDTVTQVALAVLIVPSILVAVAGVFQQWDGVSDLLLGLLVGAAIVAPTFLAYGWTFRSTRAAGLAVSVFMAIPFCVNIGAHAAMAHCLIGMPMPIVPSTFERVSDLFRSLSNELPSLRSQ